MSNFQFYADLAAKSGARGDGGRTASPARRDVDSWMKYEEKRLATFTSWISGTVTKKDLATSGFFCLNEGDKVQCAFCEGVLGDWEEDDNPDSEHRSQFPDCPFMNGKYCGNVRLIPGHSHNVPTASSGGASNIAASGEPMEESNETVDNPDINDTKYRDERSRLRTFRNWRFADKPRKEDLAKGGFVYLGDGDKTQCVFCKTILSEWEDDDTVMDEHKSQSPMCIFVKGEYCGNLPIKESENVAGLNLPVQDSEPMEASDVPTVVDIGDSKYKDEKERLKTFTKWTFADKPKKEDLAKGGFVYLGDDDRTQCVFCRMIIAGWEEDDIVLEEHKAQSLACLFVKGEPCENIPMINIDDTSALKMPVQCSDDVDQPEPMEASSETVYTPVAVSNETGDIPMEATNKTDDTPTFTNIKDSKYKEEEERLKTFNKWIFADKPKKEDLAKGGFVYIGDGDKTQCVFCEMIIAGWEDGDIVMDEHKSHSAKCTFVKGQKCGNIPMKG